MSRTVLFVVHEAGEFVELRRVAALLASHGYAITFYFAQPGYVNLKQDRGRCRMNGWTAYAPGDRIKLNEAESRRKERSSDLKAGYVPHSLLHPTPPGTTAARVAGALALPPLAVLEYFWSKRLLARRRKRSQLPARPVWGSTFRFARRLVRDLKPDLVVYGQDFPGSVNHLITRIAGEHGIPTVIVPFALGTTKEMCESLADNPLHNADFSLLNRLAAAMFPRWVNYYGTRELLRLPGQQLLVVEAMGLAPEHPWLPNSSAVTRILVESPAMERYYREMRFPDSQIQLTGSAIDDQMAAAKVFRDELRARACRLLQCDPAKPMLVCAWPTDQFGSRQVPLEFSSYAQVCEAWARALADVRRSTDYNIVIRPHPVTDRDMLGAVLKRHRLKMTEIDTMELVPVSDLFVACVSSTLRWAIAAGVPAINYDCYDYGYTDFDPAKGTFTMKRYGDFTHVLEKLTSNQAAYDEARRAQLAAAPDWGMQDGKSMERIFQALDALASGRPAAPAGA